jgi:hypothetical protein
MKAFAQKLLRNLQYIHSNGFIFMDVADGGLRTPTRVRRSAPALNPGAGSARGPTIDSGITWGAAASVQFMPGGWQASRLKHKTTADSVFLLQNLEGVERTLTLDISDPWYDHLNGKVVPGGEALLIEEGGVVNATFELL